MIRLPTIPRDAPFLSITAAGFAATVAQVLLLRELLVLFHGNEMSTALALAGWLLWTAVGSALAARGSSRIPAGESTLGVLLALLAAALPVLVLVLRGARPAFGIPAGELATIGRMVLISLSVPALVCPLAGALFGLCWAYGRSGGNDSPATRPLRIYGGEALGAGLGGIVFFFLLVRWATALEAALVVSLLLLGVSGWVLRPRSGAPSSPRPARLAWSVTAGAVLAIALLGGRLEELSRRWHWGQPLAAARDTPFHNIAILRQPNQVTVFTNGLWLFTWPDPATAEPAVHVALLQHPGPERLLLLGGGVAGHLREALKHPSIEQVDYVEQDPELVSFTEGFVSAEVRGSLRAPGVRVRREDAGRFLRRSPGGYDVILMSVGDPINAQMNRFYTVEVFRHIRRLLRPGGVFSFSVAGGGDAIGPAHARFLGSVERTLGEAFPEVAVLPGARARFLAAAPHGTLVLDPRVLTDRLEERGLDLVHVRADTLEDAMNPFRLEYLDAVLGEVHDRAVNRQFQPICYFHVLMLWAAQWHPSLEGVIAGAASVNPAHLSAGLVVAGVAAGLFFWLGRRRYREAVAASVFVQGASGMVLQVVLILGFQILEGFAYLQLALIIAFFMAGLAVGTLLITVTTPRWASASQAMGGLAVVQMAVTVLPLLFLVFFSPAGEGLREGLSSVAASWVFSAMSLAAGVLGGAHFSLAALASTAAGARLDRAGGYLYAVDLAGAAGGAFAAGLILLPLYGVSSTLILLSGASAVCFLAILRRPGRSNAVA